MNTLEIATDNANETTTTQLSIVPQSNRPRGGSFTSEVYRLHSFRVLDADGKKVGIVDWIWTDEESGHGEFLGVRMHWLRGMARAIPCLGATIDRETKTMRVAYTAAQIACARRFKIDRRLTAHEKTDICIHYVLEPATMPGLMPAQRSAA
jgi:hypothetical protein